MHNPISDVYLEVLVTVVDEEDVHKAPVVGVNDAHPSVNAKLSSETATWGDMTISTWGDSD